MADTKTHILIVEDDQFIISAFALGLENAGFVVSQAKDGEEALIKIKRERPDLVLLDLIIPKKSGMEVLAEIKAEKNLAAIPVLIVSNLEIEDKENIKALGAAEFIIKSDLTIPSLVEKIKKYCL